MGALTGALEQPWQQYAERLLEHMALTSPKPTLSHKKETFREPTGCCVQVVGALAGALGQPWQQYAERLLEPMALTGLSEELVDAMCQARLPSVTSAALCAAWSEPAVQGMAPGVCKLAVRQ